MLTSLPKHRGQHGGLIAVGVLVSTSVVVWTTQSPPPAPHEQPVTSAIRSSEQRPAAIAAPAKPAPIATIAPVKHDGAVTGTGVVTFDEARTSHVVVPVAGWFEKKRVKSVGRYVRQFEPLGVVYSVEVYAATAELIKQMQTFESQELVNAARVKLLRWGMPKPTLDQIEQRMTPQAALPIVSRVAGIVVAEQGTPTGLVEPGELFTVTDPNRAMVFVEVPEAEQIRVGMPAKLTIDGVKRPLDAKVSYVFRRADEGLRTIRFDVKAKLTPGAKVEAVIPMRRF